MVNVSSFPIFFLSNFHFSITKYYVVFGEKEGEVATKKKERLGRTK
jgi:hypothetical protein